MRRTVTLLFPLVLISLTMMFTGCEDLLNQTKDSTPPNAPRQFAVQLATNGNVEMSWIDDADNEDGYRVEYQEQGSIVWNTIIELGRNATSYAWTDAEENKVYNFRVYAFNSTDNSDYTYSINPLTIPLFGPTNLTANIDGTSIVLNWQDHSQVEESYRVQRKIGTNDFVEIAGLSSNTNTYTDTDFPSQAVLTYRVVAFAGGNVSEPSNTVQITAPLLESTVLTEDFESYDLGYYVSDPWSVNITTTDVVFGIDNSNLGSNGGAKNLAFWDDVEAEWGYADLGFTSVPRGRIEFDLYIVNDSGNPYFDFGVGLSVDQMWQSIDDMGPYMEFVSDGKLYTANGANYDSEWSFTTNDWFHMVIDFDCSTSKYRVLVNGSPVADNKTFRQNKTGNGVVGFTLRLFSTGRLWAAFIDNLTVISTAPNTTSVQWVKPQPRTVRGPVMQEAVH